ncbi:TFIIH/NER complex subunit [Ascosphaera acerosa]|nr:TFIIH/NER complex subunit [Ascosphaera acerosa]
MAATSFQVRSRNDDDEVCPVCKSTRYLTQNMLFLINPECYHRMCEACVDRIFSAGPTPCPIPGCGRTLRKNKFRKQTFEDIGVEREVDIRKRVMSILNRREEEFENKRAWDDFLEDREEIITNLVYGTDVEQTERKLAQYAQTNAEIIRRNEALESTESASFAERQLLEKEQARLRREATRRDYEEERLAKLSKREDVVNRLAAGSTEDAERIAREGARSMLKKSSARRSEKERLKEKQAALRGERLPSPTAAAVEPEQPAEAAVHTFQIKGLRKVKQPERPKIYDPCEGLRHIEQRDYFTLADTYPSRYLDRLVRDPKATVGGYKFGDYYMRSLVEAFAGLGCFVEDEVSDRVASLASMVQPSPTDVAVAAASAGTPPVQTPLITDDAVA